MGEVTLWLPDGLSLHSRMERAGLGNRTVYAEWLVSEVVRWSQLYCVPAREFVPLAFSQIRSGVPHNLVGRIKRVLIPEVLETDGRYWFGSGEAGECLGYRLAAGVTGTPVRVVRLSAWLHRKLTAAEAERSCREEQRGEELLPLYRTLRRHMQSAWLTDEAKGDPNPVVEFLAGDRPRWFVVCPQGRVHHPVAACPKRLRPYLRLADPKESLSLIDITTSQPLLLGLVIAQSCEPRELPETALARSSEMLQREKATGQRTQRRAGKNGRLYSLDSDTGRFIDECLTGDLYTQLADKMSESSWTRELTREQAKDRLWPAIYGDPWLMDKQTAGRALAALYPSFFDRVRGLAKAGEPGHLARSMQRLESEVVIQGVAAELVDRHPAVPFVTIHDAILCHTAHASLVRQVFGDVFRRRFGVTPRLKVESLAT